MEDAQFENWRPHRPLRLVDGFCVIRRGAEASRDEPLSDDDDSQLDVNSTATVGEATPATLRPGHHRNASSAVAAFLNTREFEPRATDWFLWKSEKEVREMRPASDMPVSERIHISDSSTSKASVIPKRLLQICPFVFPDKIRIARDPGEPSLHSFALTDGSGAQSCQLKTCQGLRQFARVLIQRSATLIFFLQTERH